MIKRYDFDVDVYHSVEVITHQEGEYVTYEDHAAEVARLNEQVRAIRDDRDEWERKAISNFEECAKMDDQVRALAAENAGLKLTMKEGCIWNGDEWVGLSLETPATDAILRELGARAVDAFGIYHNFSEKQLIQIESKKYSARIRAGEVQS